MSGKASAAASIVRTRSTIKSMATRSRLYGSWDTRTLKDSFERFYSGNPASSVRGPKHIIKSSKTLVLTAEETRELLDAIAIERGGVEIIRVLGRQDPEKQL